MPRPILEKIATLLAKWVAQDCLLCRRALRHNEGDTGLCAACRSQCKPLRAGCRRCALPLAAASDLCGDCLKNRPAFARSHSALPYQTPISELILSLKRGKNLPPIRALSQLFVDHLQTQWQAHPEPPPDALVPIPLHWRRQLRRGFNQSLALAHPIGQHLGLPVCPQWLARTHPTRSQQGLSRRERIANIRADCFQAAPAVQGKRIALFDDVMTTGATMNAAAKALLAAGASEVQAWSLARAKG